MMYTSKATDCFIFMYTDDREVQQKRKHQTTAKAKDREFNKENISGNFINEVNQ